METDHILADAFLKSHPAEAARAIESHPVAEAVAFLSDWPPERIAPVLTSLDVAFAAAVVSEADRDVAVRFVEPLAPVAASRLLRRVAPEVRGTILQRMSSSARSSIGVLLRYPTDSAGALLDPTVLQATSDLTVEAALDRVRRADAGGYAHLFVVDRRGMLIGVASIRDLLVSEPDALLGAIAQQTVPVLLVTANRDAILAHPGWEYLHELPVVDGDRRFLGALRYETLRRLMAADSTRPRGATAARVVLDFGELA